MKTLSAEDHHRRIKEVEALNRHIKWKRLRGIVTQTLRAANPFNNLERVAIPLRREYDAALEEILARYIPDASPVRLKLNMGWETCVEAGNSCFMRFTTTTVPYVVAVSVSTCVEVTLTKHKQNALAAVRAIVMQGG